MDQLFKMGKSLMKGGSNGSHGGDYGGQQPYYGPGGQQPGGYYGQPGQQQPYGQGGYGGGAYGSDPNCGAGGYSNSNSFQPIYGGPGQQQHYGGQPQGGYGGYGHGSAGYGHGSGGHGHGNLHGPMAIFKKFDKDHDGNITENDFVIAIREMGLGHLGDGIARSTFRSLDKNRNGRLDMNEALGALSILKGMGGGKHGHY